MGHRAKAHVPMPDGARAGSESLFSHHYKVLSTHALAPDPTHALSRVYRATCLVCGAAALQAGGPVYGSAADYTCAERVAIASAVTHS